MSRGRTPLLDWHLARLANGGAGSAVLAAVRSAVERQLERDAAAGPYARLGITVTPDGAVAAGLSHEPSSLDVDGGPRIAVVAVVERPSLPPGAAKPASRRFWDRAHRSARALGAHQAVLTDPDGTLIDGSTATVWLVRGEELLTPVAPPAIAGVARTVVFDIAAQQGIPARAAALSVRDLESADEVFLSNAVGLVVPVRGRSGPVGAIMAERLKQLFR